MACLELPSQSPRSNCENAVKEKGKKRFLASLHLPRRTSLGFESQLAPLLAEVRDLVPVGVDSGSSSWWKRDRQEARGPSPGFSERAAVATTVYSR